MEITCFNCGEAGHFSNKCTKLKKAAGKVFALNAEEVEQLNNLIRGMCFINDTPLIAIIDTGATWNGHRYPDQWLGDYFLGMC